MVERTSSTALATHRRRARGSVLVVVLWSLGMAAIVVTALQVFAFRQANVGFQSLHEVQARWAARAGVENAIATMGYHTENPYPEDAFALARDLNETSAAVFEAASYSILHHANRIDINGPLDCASKVNFNREGMPIFDLLEDASLDQMASIVDWTDPNDEPSLGGAESDYYEAQGLYTPRNGPIRSLAELELVAGIWAEFVRNEDTNLNGRRDANEDDRDRTMPEDDGDGWLDGNWSRLLTVYSVDDGATDSGEPRIHLKRATPDELVDRLGVDDIQAEALINFGQNDGNVLQDLIGLPLDAISSDGSIGTPGGGGAEDGETPAPLDDVQLRAVLAECTMYPLFDRRPGRININTVDAEVLRDLLELQGFDELVADELLYLRNGRPEGFTSEIEFGDIQAEVSVEDLRALAQLFTVRGNVYRISSIGRSTVSGAEVEILVTVDRSTVPVRIIEYREQ